jgi:integrase
MNQRLKDSGNPARVRQKGKQLYIRVTVPMPLGVGTIRPELTLGIPASKDGLKFIETECHELGKQLMIGAFDLNNWKRDRIQKVDEMPISVLVQKFKEHYIRASQTTRKPIKESTWNDTWALTFRELPQEQSLTETLALALVERKEPDSCIRQRTYQRMQALCDYAGLKVDLKPHKGKYGKGSEEPRNLPKDGLIMEWRNRIEDSNWQWVYGMLAAFGLRPHEVFACEFINPLTVKVYEKMQVRAGVSGTKTGFRITRAIYPKWAEDWNLIQVDRPKISGQTPRAYGQRVSQAFGRAELPFLAYDLRHAYAIRGSVVEGLAESVMAKQMGHSPQVHRDTYHHWIDNAQAQQVYDEVILKKSRETP